MPTKTARKTQKAKKTVRQGVAEKLSHIERALADIRQMVDMNCGEAVLRTARAAGAAAAEEVLTTLSPAIAPANAAALFNTPPELPTLAPPAAAAPMPTARKTQKVKKTAAAAPAPANNNAEWQAALAAENARIQAEEAAAAAPVAEAAKKPGPKLWNEFLRNYMARQEAAGRKITRLQAMAEAGPNYRTKYGIKEKKTHKTAKNAAKTLGAVQVAPVESPEVVNVDGNALLNRGAVPIKKGVKIQAPGNAVPVTPGRPSPPVPLTAAAATGGILNTLREALTGSPASTASSSSSNNSSSTSSSSSSNNSSSTSSSSSSNNSSSNASGSPVTSPAANNRPNTTYYGYENLGTEENGTRKVKIGGEDYLMTNQNRGLFRPVDGSLEWVGYLEPGGIIRATNAPE
jgi:hypothetical protein